MNVDIKKIKLKELENFIISKDFLALENKPISTLRVKSYITNPNANRDSYVLYMAYYQSKLVGYRTILEDVFYNGFNQEKFGWLSGNWVHKNYRRKGVSTKLFTEVTNDWSNKLMFSNYAEASKLLYDKTEQFSKFAELKGYRYYFKSCMSQILPSKHVVFKILKPLLKGVDALINVFIPYKKSVLLDFNIRKIMIWNNNHSAFLEIFKEKELFRRDTKTFNWIIQNPWIKSNKRIKKEAIHYNFSLHANFFNNSFYELKKGSNIIAIVQLQMKDKELKIPYLYVENKNLIEVKKFILQTLKKYKLQYITIYHNELNREFQKVKLSKYQKSFSQKFFCSSNLSSHLKNGTNKNVNSGDGDSVFT